MNVFMKLLKNNKLMYHTGTVLCRNLVYSTNFKVSQVLLCRKLKFLFKHGTDIIWSKQNDPIFYEWTTRYLINFFIRLFLPVEKIHKYTGVFYAQHKINFFIRQKCRTWVNVYQKYDYILRGRNFTLQVFKKVYTKILILQGMAIILNWLLPHFIKTLVKF